MFRKCPNCGANLDPEEKCDCQNATDLEKVKKYVEDLETSCLKKKETNTADALLKVRVYIDYIMEGN